MPLKNSFQQTADSAKGKRKNITYNVDSTTQHAARFPPRFVVVVSVRFSTVVFDGYSRVSVLTVLVCVEHPVLSPRTKKPTTIK